MLCSVTEHLRSSESTLEVGANTHLQLKFSPTILLCSRHFLCALYQNRAQLRLLYLLNHRNSMISALAFVIILFPRSHCFNTELIDGIYQKGPLMLPVHCAYIFYNRTPTILQRQQKNTII